MDYRQDGKDVNREVRSSEGPREKDIATHRTLGHLSSF
jgi:hypothetical protein